MDLQNLGSGTVFVLIGGMLLGGSVVYLVVGDFVGPQDVAIQNLELNPENYEDEEVTITGVAEEAGWNYDFRVADSLGYSVGVNCDQAPSGSLESGVEVTVTGEVVNNTGNQDNASTGESEEASGTSGNYYYPDFNRSSTASEYFIECTEPVR